VVLFLLALQNTEAANYIRGASLELHRTESSDVATAVTAKKLQAIDYATVGMGVGIGALVAGAVVAGIFFATKKKDEAKDGEEKAEPLLGAEDEEAGPKQVDYAELLRNLTQKVSDEVGPKLQKDGAVRELLEKRLDNFQDKAKNFMLNEMNLTAAAVKGEIEKDESGLMMEWNNAVESNFPPASILIAGALSPTVINIMAFNHFIQLVTVGLPLFCLCVAALYVDWGAPCTAIPTLYEWLYTQTVLSFCFVIGHGALLGQLSSGKARLNAKRQEVEENLQGTEEGGFANLKEKFIGNTIILQEALLVENGVRHSPMNMITGVATVIWIFTTIWNLVLVAGWTFVPGVVAFHPDAAEVAKDEYCGAWMTVLVLKICILLSVLYLFLNLATVAQWIADMMIESKGFSDAVLLQARKADRDGTGVPAVEMLAKAFLLRGGDESLISKLAVAQHHKNSLINKRTKALAKACDLEAKISNLQSEESGLLDKSKDGGDLAAQVAKLSDASVNYELWQKQGNEAIDQARDKAVAIGEASTEALEEIYQQINDVIEEVKNSPAIQAAAQQAKEAAERAFEQAQAMALEKYNQAQAMYNDPEFQAKLQEYQHRAHEAMQECAAKANDLADKAVAMAKDPEFQRQLQEAAQKAMDQAQEAAKEAKKALGDPELQRKLEEAMAMAKAKAEEAAAAVGDPQLQQQMKETAQKAMAQAEDWADSATAALNDPEMQKLLSGLQDKALSAMEDAKKEAEAALAAATDPNLKVAALAKLTEAREAAEKAAQMATDPETKKKFEEAAAKAMEQAGSMVDPEVKKKLKEMGDEALKSMEEAKKQAQEVAKKATDPKLQEAALAKLQEAQEAAEKAAKIAADPAAKKKLEEAAQKAMDQAKKFADDQIAKYGAIDKLKEAQAAAEKALKEAVDPEAKVKILAQFKEAQAAAEQAVKFATDPETKHKLEKAAQKALDQGAALMDPEVKKQIKAMQDTAMKAVDDAKKQAEEAAKAAADPALRDAALAKIKEAQKAAEEAAKVAADPATKKKLEEAAQKAMEQADALAKDVAGKAKDVAAKAKAAAGKK
jgi:hypothetical protein